MNKIPILNFVKGKKEIELFHNKEFKKIDKDIVRLKGGKSEVDPLQIDKPQNDE